MDTILAEQANIVDYAGKPLLLVVANTEAAAFAIAGFLSLLFIYYFLRS